MTDTSSTYYVFFEDGSQDECGEDDLQVHASRDDFLFALDLDGSGKVIIEICEDLGLPWKVYGSAIETAFLAGARTGGCAGALSLSGRLDDPD